MNRRSVLILGVAIALFLSGFWGLAMKKPANLGVRDGAFTSCPSTPNCVSTQCPDGSHYMEPIAMVASRDATLKAIVAVLERMPGIRVRDQTAEYVRAEATSRVLRFVDDVEFYVDSDRKQIEFRSASRIGHSDLGANRNRMLEFRRLLSQELK